MADAEKNRSWWFELHVSRVYQCLDAFRIEVFGRRAFPYQVYASDSRLALWGKAPQPEKASSPRPSIARFEQGVLDDSPDLKVFDEVVTVDIEVKEDQLKIWPCLAETQNHKAYLLFVPVRFLEGQLPHVLLEAFHFWQLHYTNAHGQPQPEPDGVTVRKGHLLAEPITDDTYCQYSLHVQIEPGLRTSVFRYDPTTKKGDPPRQLVDLTDVLPGSKQAEVVRLLSGLENLSHIVCWEGPAIGRKSVMVAELPRLRMRFEVEDDKRSGRTRLLSLDRAGRYVVTDQENDPAVLPEAVDGIRYLLLADSSGAREVVVPNYNLVRAEYQALPWSTFSVEDRRPRQEPAWRASCNARYFTYPVHWSQGTLLFESLGAMLYYGFCMQLARKCAPSSAANRAVAVPT